MLHIFFVFLRCLIGVLFIVSGGEKVISPTQNFIYVIHSYDFLPDVLVSLAAHLVPWTELIVGVFLVIGLNVRFSLYVTAGLFASFQVIVLQAILRKLPIDECGCFGEMISFPLHVVFIFDACMFLLTILLIKKITLASQWSLDQIFNKS